MSGFFVPKNLVDSNIFLIFTKNNTMESLEFYVVRSKDGNYLRAKGYSGSGDSWVSDLKRAKVYTKRQGATAQITWWANNYPEFGVPDLIPLISTLGEPIPQEERVAKVQKKKELDKTRNELWRAQKNVEEAMKEMERIKGPDWFKDKLINAQSKVGELEEKIRILKH